MALSAAYNDQTKLLDTKILIKEKVMKMKTFRDIVESEKEIPFSKSSFMKALKSGKGVVVYGAGGGYADTREFGLDKDQVDSAIEKGKEDILFKNAQSSVKNAKDSKMKGRKFYVRFR